ncbi:hypothetical protein DY000_02015133 [Brassica cretica]|uniref:Protein kinase domain-containing protein n=1 Tax=Brassica cretica TaxID=69181 RepID=A0ABQ7D624_BRACR|nr:hypothetical protein DY000_02015133 [Brassica cretica]
MGVIHRDLTPENFLLLNKDKNSPLKSIDVGVSNFYKPGDVFKDIVGNAYYIALEVLKRKYESEADIWSIGVILYVLLCGVSPIWVAFQCYRFEVNQHPVSEAMPVLLKSGQFASREEAVEEMKNCRSMKHHWCR